MNRIESAVTYSVNDITPLDMDTAAVPVATPWAVAGVVVGAAALGYQVGYNLGGSLGDDLDGPSSVLSALELGASSSDLLAVRTAILTD